ncbi:LamG domain-containing protein [Colwellia sp. MSW7]|uniref:LamG domain-containing protein n=1 Tax=Colwellia maritima TaxID=2912588 RepID=A0ABS9X4V0_9GAMM|nr:LamG domain-containing protein [Colwellia maritima]MCI2285254.1 LamG domain-containing protein [Colwellia maritima]
MAPLFFGCPKNGVVLGDNFVTDGKATAILSGGLVGEVAVTATIGDRLLLWEGSFESNSAIKVKVEHPYIVAGEKSNGIGEVVRGDGTVSKIPYWSSSNVEVTGPENAWLDIGVSDNKKTEIFLFEELDVDITKGNLKGHEIKVSGAILDTIVRHSGSGAFLFDGQGQGVITHHDDFNFKEEFSISVWLRPNEITNAQILKKGSDWQLTLLDDGKIKATIKTNVASYEVISDAKVEVGSWSYVSIDYGSNGLRLTIGVDAKSNGNAQGLLSNNNGNIAIADNFNGHVDDLVFSSTNKDAEIRFEGLDGTGRLQLDSSGHANFQVLNTGDLTSRISSRVPITIRSTPVRQSKTKLSRSISVLSNSPSEATEDEESVTTYVQIVERDTWFLLVDTVTSFFGGDPESGLWFCVKYRRWYGDSWRCWRDY